ncbi:MAG: bifunctional 5,10-methylenetetrahydrofolate dehydrogenase/5,10-methenyltetrahydrofolate cyclohydrolase [Promethearchaeota archaeon]
MGKILDGKKLAQKLNIELKSEFNQLYRISKIKPKLATILVGEDPASQVYINIKRRVCAEVGIESISIKHPATINKDELIASIRELNYDDSIHGILLQIPLPDHLKLYGPAFISQISPLKDVDGLHPINKGRLFDYNEDYAPCTPKGIIALLEHYNVNIKGKFTVIINRSNLVGKPLIFLLLKRNATVVVCHTSTVNLENLIKMADILIVAVGKPNFISKEKIKEGVIIIDIGVSRVHGKLCGDVDFDDVFEKCGMITPNPGGIGPLTVSFLMRNTLIAYQNQLKSNLTKE